MKIKHKLGLLACAMAFLPLPALANDRAATEQIVRNYLLEHPEVIREALGVLQQREAAAAEDTARRALAAHQDELLADPTSPVLGNPDGDVTIVEFFDYRCGYCKRVEPAIESVLQRDDKVKLVLKELPILGPDSLLAAKAALAAHKQGRYGELHAALMKAPATDLATIDALATGLGLDMDKFRVDREAVMPILEKNHNLATALGINGTPAFVIGDRLLPGAADAAALGELIAAVRASRQNLSK